MNKMLKIIGTVAIINIVARLFGFLREMVISNQFGTSAAADAIAAAYTIPNFIYLVVGGGLTTAFISVYHSSKTDKALFVRRMFTSVLMSATTITVLAILFAQPLLRLAFKDMSVEQFDMTFSLFMWMMPSTVILVLSTWLSGLLNLNDKFKLSSVAILVYNAAFVIISAPLVAFYGPTAYGIGALLSALLMGLFLFVGVKRSKLYSLKPMLGKSEDVRRVWVIALPILLGGASMQFYAFIQRIAASGMSEGYMSAVNYASKLSNFPQAIMITAVTTVIYPLLSKKQGEGDNESIKKLYKKGLLLLAALIIPATAIAFFFAEPLVRLIFERGNFGPDSTMITTPIFRIFTLSMFFLAANTYVTRFYYAKGNSMLPVIFSLISVLGINILVIYALIDSMGAVAIAYGTVISSAINLVMLMVYARLKWRL
ncbi:murein biosynthesis integral membrane protein MurJ [Sporosarcina sp. Sa2YVA2]|uniref:Murein biosynthesis integral membrane protein MurJ n=1 Tax=Sporosarcina quadrami TaxID=2762234 RepID=A0ABR8UA76_9BACL|nr:murein biosynthesis integral membrane protein MurJ [Sporosarcina quadrami]MBD7984705.1 murein biosynthesis integral membrane protein MurJ [Sporosarcina quadrami]